MITYTWKFDPLTCYTQKDGHDTVVLLVHWQLTAEDEEHRAQFVGVQSLTTVPPADKFIPFNTLTHDTVQQWVINSLGEHAVSEIMEFLQEQLANKTNMYQSWESTSYESLITLPQYEGTFITLAPPWYVHHS